MMGVGRVGVLTAALPGERLDLCEPFHEELCKALLAAGFEIRRCDHLCLSREDLLSTVELFVGEGLDAVCYGIGTWVDSSSVVAAVRRSRLPALVVGNHAAPSFGFPGASAVHGALDRLGLPHCMFHGEPKGGSWLVKAVPYLRAAAVKSALASGRLGLIGGQSPGQSTGNLELAEVMSSFGLETVQIDQLMLVEKARRLGDGDVTVRRRQFEADFGQVGVSDEQLCRSLALMLALEQLIEDESLGIACVKCLTDAINVCGSFCLPVSLLNSSRQTVSCQGDIPAIILMECFRLLSGEPAFFGDLVALDLETAQGRVINCGACAVGLAPDLASVVWQAQYQYMGEGGGVTARFAIKPGPVTIASMSKTPSGLRMMIASAEALEYPAESFSDIRDAWPQGLVKFNRGAERLVDELRSNHIVAGYGVHEQSLSALATMWGVAATIV